MAARKKTKKKTSRKKTAKKAASRGRKATKKKAAKKKATKKKATKKKATRKKATKKKATKKKATKKKATKKKATKKKATKKKATKKKATKKKATKKKATKKKATKKKATKKKATKKKATKKKATKKKATKKKATKAAPRRDLAALERLRFLSHVEEADRDEVDQLLGDLAHHATSSALPAMFGMLAGDDPHDVNWSIFFIMEGFDDAYLEALLQAMPEFWEQSPVWAQTAVIRILNTRGEDDDCTKTFEGLAKKTQARNRKALSALLKDLLDDQADPLIKEQRDSIEGTLRAIGARA